MIGKHTVQHSELLALDRHITTSRALSRDLPDSVLDSHGTVEGLTSKDTANIPSGDHLVETLEGLARSAITRQEMVIGLKTAWWSSNLLTYYAVSQTCNGLPVPHLIAEKLHNDLKGQQTAEEKVGEIKDNDEVDIVEPDSESSSNVPSHIPGHPIAFLLRHSSHVLVLRPTPPP